VLAAFTDPRCLSHDPPGFPERAARLSAVLEGLRAAGIEVRRQGRHAAAVATAREVHDPAYVERLQRAVERGDGLIDSADNPLTPTTWKASLAAVESTLHAADWLMAGPERRAFAAVRPPGHHAERSRAMGFCYLANLAIAARHLQARHGIERLAVYDFDVHHGNGTQHLFDERCDVVFVSTHQYPFYPGSGAASERGRGAGEGCTVNVPLAAGCDDEALARALEESVLPALEEARPDVLLVSAGFDAWRRDPLGGLRWGEESYRRIGEALGTLAARVCDGRVLTLLEGGYDIAALPGLVATCLTALEAAAGGEARSLGAGRAGDGRADER
jgi:acetoin utilization deacetylase AcuC-like enzyme